MPFAAIDFADDAADDAADVAFETLLVIIYIDIIFN